MSSASAAVKHCRYSGPALLCVVGVVFLAGCRTQPTVPYGIKTLEFTDFSGHVDLVVRRQERDLKSKTGTGETRSEETVLEESLSLETEGYMFHPNILEFGLGGMFGLVQEDFEDLIDGRLRETSSSGNLLEFDVHAQTFKRGTYPMSAFAQRRRGLVPRPFLPSLETITTNYGFTWQYVSKKMPTSIQFTHIDTKLSPLFVGVDPEQEGRQRSTQLRFETGYHFSDHNVLSLTYEHELVDEEPFELDYTADEATLTHQLEFGGGRQHNLRSELNILDQRGTIDIQRTRWREDLRLKHSDTLESLFQFELLDRSRGSRSRDVPRVEERSIYLSGSARHQLFESQTLQLRAFVRKQEFERGLDLTRWGGQANLNYHKTNRWGVLHANYGFRFERNDTRGEAQVTEVIDEAHTIRDPDPITLSNRNVVAGSISVRAEDRVTFYNRGRDFTVLTVGDLVEIQRMPTGRIADGQTVLIDYLYNLGGTFKLDTVGHNFGIRQDFEFGLMPYYRFEWQDQSISPVSATGAIAEDITAHVVGVEYRRSSLRLFAEYENYDSTINPFVSSRLGGSYTHRFRSGATTSLHSRWTDTSHGAPNKRDIKLLTLEARHRHPITRNLTTEGSVLYRNGEDSLSRDTEGLEVSFSLEWSFREVEVRLRFEYDDFEDQFTENDSSALFVHVRRGF